MIGEVGMEKDISIGKFIEVYKYFLLFGMLKGCINSMVINCKNMFFNVSNKDLVKDFLI